VPTNSNLRIPDFVKYLAIAFVIVAILLAVVLWGNRGSQVRLEGRVLKTRLVPTEAGATLAVLEARIDNPANVTFVVRDVHFRAVLADGTTLDADPVPQIDLDRLLAYLKIYGPRYNPVMKAKDSLPGRSETDRTIAGIFARKPADIEHRKGFVIEVEDVDGAVTRIAETGAESK